MPRVTEATIDQVKDLWEKVRQYHNRQGKLPEHVAEDNEKLTSLLLRVVRADKLTDLPPELQSVAHQRMEMLRTFGDRKTLRGLEKGVKAPFSVHDGKLYAAISKLAPGRSQTQVLSLLQQKGLLDRRTSRQAFHKLLTRLEALHLFEN